LAFLGHGSVGTSGASGTARAKLAHDGVEGASGGRSAVGVGAIRAIGAVWRGVVLRLEDGPQGGNQKQGREACEPESISHVAPKRMMLPMRVAAIEWPPSDSVGRGCSCSILARAARSAARQLQRHSGATIAAGGRDGGGRESCVLGAWVGV
jgi:hypothetical protein